MYKSARANCPSTRCNTICSTIHVFEKRNHAASLSLSQAHRKLNVPKTDHVSRRLSTTALASFPDIILSLLLLSQQLLQLSKTQPSQKMISRVENSEETLLSLSSQMRHRVVLDGSFFSKSDATCVIVGQMPILKNRI